MPEYDDYDEDDENDEPEQGKFARVPRDAIKRLEKKAARADAAEEKLAAYERQEAFRAVGLDPTDPKAKYFVKGYDGALDPEAIKTAAIEAGYLQAPEPAVPDAELAAHQAVSNAAAGGVGNSATDQDAAYEAELAGAGSQGEVLAVMAKYGKPVSTFAQ